MDLTREEVVWWHTPDLVRRRQWFREYLERGHNWCDWEIVWQTHSIDDKPMPVWDESKIKYVSVKGKDPRREGRSRFHQRFLGDYDIRKHEYPYKNYGPVSELPVLLFRQGTWTLEFMHRVDSCGFFSFDTGWRYNSSFYANRENWEDGKIKGSLAITGQNDPTLNTLERVIWVLNDPRTVDLNSIPETDDTSRLVRLIQTAYQRFVVDEVPTVPSLWQEGDQVLCGWNELFPFDGREIHPGSYETKEWGGVEFWDTSNWRWRVPK